MTTITERKYPTSEEYPLVKAFSLNDRKPRLIGSAGLKSQLYTGDYDFTMDISDLPRDVVFTGLNDVVNNIIQNPDLYFVEMKIQSNAGKKERIYRGAEFLHSFFSRIPFDDIDFIKVDVVFRKEVSNEFFDASCLYGLGDALEVGENADDERLKELEQDFGGLISEGKYWKALKRLFSMMRIKNEEPETAIQLVKLFNSETGKLYQITSQLKAVQTLKWELDKTLKLRVSTFLQAKLGMKGSITRARVDNVIKNNEKIINKTAQRLLCSII
jgi:hypothetical protein